MKPTALITGCGGLLGNHYSRFLLQKGYTVIGVDDLSGSYKEYLPTGDNFYFHKLKLEENPNSLSKLFEEHQPSTVYHFAAYAAEGLSPFVRRYNYTNNVLASVTVINNCIKFGSKLVFTSSMAVYGSQTPPFTEDLNPSPYDPYGIAKYAVEMDIKQAGDHLGLQYSIIRPHNVVGIYQNIWDKYRNVIGIFIRRTLNKEPILVYGDGEQTRAFSDVKYYMEPFHLLEKTQDGETFNIGADNYWTLNHVAETVQKIGAKHGYNNTIKHVEPRHEVKHAHCNHDKAKTILKFKDETDLETLVESLFLWAQDQPPQPMRIMEYELTDGIYEYWK